MAASLGGNPSIVAALLEKKAGVNAVSNVSVASMLS
jgi:orotate phosphoribosyltransferase-like protein